MRTDYGWHNYIIGVDGTNSSGFSGLPGGKRDPTAYFNDAGIIGKWWSSSPSYYGNGTYAYLRSLSYNSEIVQRGGGSPTAGLSVRCLRDAE